MAKKYGRGLSLHTSHIWGLSYSEEKNSTVRTSSTNLSKILINLLDKLRVKKKKKLKCTENMKYSLQGHKANSFHLQVSLMSLSSLSSPVETNPTCHLSYCHIIEAWGGMLTNKHKNPPHNWLQRVRARPQKHLSKTFQL